MTVTELIEKAKAYLPAEKVAVVQRAYEFAARAHQGQFRKSGEPYIEHPLHVAMILAELQLDASTLAAALLHDVEENCGITGAEINEKFGPEITKLVNAATKLGKLTMNTTKEDTRKGSALSNASQAENLKITEACDDFGR